jgi:hypothetical protein
VIVPVKDNIDLGRNNGQTSGQANRQDTSLFSGVNDLGLYTVSILVSFRNKEICDRCWLNSP